jgi:hypothetical protein
MSRNARWTTWILVSIVLSLLSARRAAATQVRPLSMAETVRQSDAIVSGTVTGKQSRWGDASQRWMLTDYTIAVDDVIIAPAQRTIGKTLTVTWWGGTIGEISQGISDLRLPAAGERLLLMLRGEQGAMLSPVVGFNQGFFSISGAGDTALVLDSGGQPLTLTSGQVLRRGEGRSTDAPSLDLATFTAWLRANAAAIHAAPPQSFRVADPHDPRVLAPRSLVPDRAGLPVAAPVLARPAAGGGSVAAPAPPAGAGMLAPARLSTTPSHVPGPIRPQYSTQHQAHLPIIVNELPSSFTPWSPEDQYQMSKWNYYADVFRVYTTPSGTYGWNNGRFDLAGWPSSAELQSVYGSGWDPGVIGVTFVQWDGGGWITEADIALNPAFSFTLDDEWVYDGAPAEGFRQVMTHELGHMHGLQHQFNYLSVMNYMPEEFRFFGIPYADDAAGVRAEYPAAAVSLTDLGVYLYYDSGYQSVSDATYPVSVTAGAGLTVNNYQVENVGTNTISVPTIEWYLTAGRTFGSDYYYLGSSTYPSLAAFTSFTPSTVQRTFTVPVSVPSGDYYLSAFIRDDDGVSQSSFPFSNNTAFSRLTLHVNCASGGVTASNNGPVCTGSTVQLSATTVSGATYSWTGPNGFTSNVQNPSISSVTTAAAGVYTVTTHVGSCSLPSATTTVSIAALTAPAGLVATASSTSSVALTWTAGACAASYDVYRSSSGTSFGKIGSSGSTGYADGAVSASTSYLYAVRSLASGGGTQSALSGADLATTVVFTDPTLSAGVTTMKGTHILQLRTAVAAVRSLASLSAATFTDPVITAGLTTVKAAHITELRTALNAARSALGLPAIVYTDPTLSAGTTLTKGAHITDLRNGVR